jgi:inosine-uridine nucleoside N-ribohydrolase
VLLLNKAEQYQLDAGLQNWECADCFAAAAIVDPSIIQESAKFYAYVAYDGTFSRGTVYVDYKGRVGISPNIEIVRSIDVDQYKKMLLSNIGHTELAEAEKVLNTKTDLHPTMKHNPCNL